MEVSPQSSKTGCIASTAGGSYKWSRVEARGKEADDDVLPSEQPFWQQCIFCGAIELRGHG